MRNLKAREGQWYADKATHDVFCVIAIDEDDGYIDVRDRYGDIDEFDLDEWQAMDLELCSAPKEWSLPLQQTTSSAQEPDSPVRRGEQPSDHDPDR